MSEEREEATRRSRWRWLRDAFSLEPDYEGLTDEEVALLDRIAAFVVRRGLVTPALLILESVKPLNYVGSQAMAFFEPMVRTLFTGADYSRLQAILERRQSIEVLMQRIEQADAESEADRAARRETGGDDRPAEAAAPAEEHDDAAPGSDDGPDDRHDAR